MSGSFLDGVNITSPTSNQLSIVIEATEAGKEDISIVVTIEQNDAGEDTLTIELGGIV